MKKVAATVFVGFHVVAFFFLIAASLNQGASIGEALLIGAALTGISAKMLI